MSILYRQIRQQGFYLVNSLCMNKDLKDKTLSELEQIVVGMGQKKYLAEYIFQLYTD